MLFRSVFSRPISADWEVSEEVEVFSASFALTNGSPNLYLDTYRTDVDINQLISGTGIPTGTLVQAITSSNIKTLGAITGGSLYTNGSYPGVTLTGGNGNGATADIVVSGNAVTSVTIVSRGHGYWVGDVLSASAASIGGTGSGFQIPVSAIYAQGIVMTANATSTSTETLTFSTQPDRKSTRLNSSHT